MEGVIWDRELAARPRAERARDLRAFDLNGNGRPCTGPRPSVLAAGRPRR